MFSRSNWKILHLARFFTHPAFVMVVTNSKYGWRQHGSTALYTTYTVYLYTVYIIQIALDWMEWMNAP